MAKARLLYKAMGLAMEDMVAANLAYQRAKREGGGDGLVILAQNADTEQYRDGADEGHLMSTGLPREATWHGISVSTGIYKGPVCKGARRCAS